MKKGFSIIMAFVTVMTMLFSGATFADDTNENTENKTKESNFTNLIVFARFLDEDEFIELGAYTIEELKGKIFSGEIEDAKTVSSLMAYAVKYGK